MSGSLKFDSNSLNFILQLSQDSDSWSTLSEKHDFQLETDVCFGTNARIATLVATKSDQLATTSKDMPTNVSSPSADASGSMADEVRNQQKLIPVDCFQTFDINFRRSWTGLSD
jgi:hypothetical protein